MSSGALLLNVVVWDSETSRRLGQGIAKVCPTCCAFEPVNNPGECVNFGVIQVREDVEFP